MPSLKITVGSFCITSTFLCLLVCFVSLPGRDKDLNVSLTSRCVCLSERVARGWDEHQVGRPAESPVNMGQANAKKVCWLNHERRGDCENDMQSVFPIYWRGVSADGKMSSVFNAVVRVKRKPHTDLGRSLASVRLDLLRPSQGKALGRCEAVSVLTLPLSRIFLDCLSGLGII